MYQYLLGKVSTKAIENKKEIILVYQYLLGKVSTKDGFLKTLSLHKTYQYLLGKVSTF